jgi:hypothetical protein
MNKKLLLAPLAIAIALAATGCSSNTTTAQPGNPAVYERINTTSDCTQLQREFDTAMTRTEHAGGTDKTAMAYAQTAQARIEKVCS